jgi:sorting nexin-13
MLLLLDEVFDLKSRNQWLRRRIINIVRQIIKGMFGDIVNRRIVDYVTWLTSPARVATYIEFFRFVGFNKFNKLFVLYVQIYKYF